MFSSLFFSLSPYLKQTVHQFSKVHNNNRCSSIKNYAYKGKKVLFPCRQNFTPSWFFFFFKLLIFVLQCGLWADNSRLTHNPNRSFSLQKTISDKWKEVSLSESDSFIMSPVILSMCRDTAHQHKKHYQTIA